jgi:hypothetical protein
MHDCIRQPFGGYWNRPVEGTVERKFLLLPGCVRVLLERGSEAADTVPILADAILLAKKKRRDGLLVISGLDDPATAASLADALHAMHAAGAPPPSKLAFVALMYPQYEVYHFAEHLAPRYGMQAKVFADVVDAKIWLQATGAGSRRRAPRGSISPARS